MQAQASDRPRFRQDLVAEPIEDAGARFIDVMDPDSGTVFRFYEVEYSIACAMDGERDVAGIVQWAQEELGLTPSATEVKTVIATLGDLGYLSTAAAAAVSAPEPEPFDPERTTLGAVDPLLAAEPTPAPEPTYVPTPAASAAGPAVARLALRRTPASGLTAITEKRSEKVTAQQNRNEDLAAGVVVGKQRDAAAVESADFELGVPGALSNTVVQAVLPNADDLELGASGSKPARAPTPLPVEDIPLGASGPGTQTAVTVVGNMSVDLSDQVAIGVADVKEAVRASKVMSAVEIPKELRDALEPEIPAAPAPAPVVAPAPAPAPAPVVAKAPEPVKPAAEPAKPAAAAKAAEPAKPAAAAKAAEPVKPVAKPAVEAEAAKPVPAPAPSSRRMLLLFVLLLAVAGAFFVWHYNLLGTKAEPAPEPTSAVTPVVPPKPAPPAPEVQKLALAESPAQELKPGMTGPLDMVAASDTVVAAGDVVATLDGHQHPEKQIADEQRDIGKLPEEIAGFQKERDAAAAANNAAAVAAADKKLQDGNARLDAHKATLATRQGELAKFQIKAPVAGKVTAVAKTGARVTPADVVAKVTPLATLTATFKAPAGMTLAADGAVKLDVQADHHTIICPAKVEAGTVKVSCLAGAAADGTALSLVGPADAGAALTGAPAAGSAAAGSAAAGSAAAGSASGSATGSAAAGSATAP